MKKLLSLAVAGFALAATSQPTDARTQRGRTVQPSRDQTTVATSQASRAVQPSRDRTRLAANQASRSVQPARSQASRTVPRTSTRAVQPARTTTNELRRPGDSRVIGSSGRTGARTQPSVAVGGGERWRRTDRTLADEHIDARRDSRDRNWALDRERNRIRTGDREWNRGDLRYRRPPNATWRNWDRDRVYSWDNNRWHWYGGSWVVVGAAPSAYYYDYDQPYETTYGYASSSTVAEVQRELAHEGFDPGPIDGVLGGQTRSAIVAFQRDNGLSASGRIDSALMDALDIR